MKRIICFFFGHQAKNIEKCKRCGMLSVIPDLPIEIQETALNKMREIFNK